MEGTNDRQRLGGMQTITETEDMRATKIEFILGRRPVGTGGSAIMPKERGPNDESYEYGNEDYSYFLSGTDGVNGVVTVGQDPNGALLTGSRPECREPSASEDVLARVSPGLFCDGAPEQAYQLSGLGTPSGADMVDPVNGEIPEALWLQCRVCRELCQLSGGCCTAASTITDVPDFAPMLGEDGSDLKNPAPLPRKQGVFVRDDGPFLRGKGITNSMLNGTIGGMPTSGVFGKQQAAYRVSRNLGDEIAFDLLDKAMEEAGLTDWRPDGIVLSKGANDPSDQLSDEFFEARDGQLYNRHQGPAHTTTWTGDPAMEVLPGDKVFIAIVADVWFNTDQLTGGLADVKTCWTRRPAPTGTNTQRRQVLQKRAPHPRQAGYVPS